MVMGVVEEPGNLLVRARDMELVEQAVGKGLLDGLHELVLGSGTEVGEEINECAGQFQVQLVSGGVLGKRAKDQYAVDTIVVRLEPNRTTACQRCPDNELDAHVLRQEDGIPGCQLDEQDL